MHKPLPPLLFHNRFAVLLNDAKCHGTVAEHVYLVRSTWSRPCPSASRKNSVRSVAVFSKRSPSVPVSKLAQHRLNVEKQSHFPKNANVDQMPVSVSNINCFLAVCSLLEPKAHGNSALALELEMHPGFHGQVRIVRKEIKVANSPKRNACTQTKTPTCGQTHG